LHVVVKGQWAALSQVIWVFGDGLVVIAMVAWAAYALLLKKWASPLSSTARLAATCFAGCLVLLPLAITEWVATEHAGWSDSASLLVVAAAVFPGVGAYWAYGFCQKTLGASRVATSLYLGPLYGGLVAWLFLDETLGWHHAVGAAFILPGIYLASQKGNVRKSDQNVVLTVLQHAGNSALGTVFTKKFLFVTAVHCGLQVRHQAGIRLSNGPQTLI
jgi:drug/metabolite transporter (DMT)-like permease